MWKFHMPRIFSSVGWKSLKLLVSSFEHVKSPSWYDSPLLSTAIPSSLCRLCRFVFLKSDLVLSRMQAAARLTSHAYSCHPPTARQVSSSFFSGVFRHCHTPVCLKVTYAVLIAFQIWLGLSNVWCWFDLPLADFWRSDWLLFLLVSVGSLSG